MRSVTRPAQLDPQAADALVARTVLPVAGVLAVIFAFFIGVDLFVRPPEIGLPLLPVDIASIVLFGGIALWHWRRPPSAAWAQPTLALVIVSILATLVHLFVVQPIPVHTLYLILVVIGAGSLFLSWSWYAASAALTLSAWGFGASLAGDLTAWMDHGFGLVAAVGLGAILQSSRQRTFARLHAAHGQEVKAREELEVSLGEARLNESRFQLLAAATQDVAWDLDVRAGKLWWNDNFYRVFGHPRIATVATTRFWTDCIHPQDRKRVSDSLRETLAGRSDAWSQEYRLRRADGSYLVVLDRGCVLRDEEGAKRMVGSLTDVTLQREAEAASRRQTELYEKILDALGDAGHAVALVENGEVQYANEGARTFLEIQENGACGPLVAAALGALARHGGPRVDLAIGEEGALELSAYALDRGDARRVLLIARAGARAEAAVPAPVARESRVEKPQF